MSDAHDEISLRDLYLIVRRGLPLILVVSLLAAGVALAWVSLRTQRYQAETTVVINPTPVRLQGNRNLGLEQRNDVSWETYQRIANSRSVLEEAVSSLGDADITVLQLRGSGKLEKLVGPQRPDQVAPLTISHAVVHTDPALAAAAADAWATATVETVSASMLASLDPVRTATAQQLESLERRLDTLEDRWTDFQTRDESVLIEARLEGLAERIPLTEERREEVQREIAAARGARQALAALGNDASGATGDAEAALALLGGQEQLPAETIAELAALVRQAGDGQADLVGLVRQVELQRLTGELAGLLAQEEAATAQLERLREQGRELREQQAGLVLERDKLQQQLDSARAAHADLSDLEPVLEYLHELAPTNSRIVGNASIPTEPVGPRRLLVSVLAALVGAMLALLVVFVRAAVSEDPVPTGRDSVRASTAH